jgi:GDPmannose 4,6-dehydratase
VRNLVELAFAAAGLDWRRHVEVDRAIFGRQRSMLCAATPARRVVFSAGSPRVTFTELVKMMVEHDIDLARRERDR